VATSEKPPEPTGSHNFEDEQVRQIQTLSRPWMQMLFIGSAADKGRTHAALAIKKDCVVHVDAAAQRRSPLEGAAWARKDGKSEMDEATRGGSLPRPLKQTPILPAHAQLKQGNYQKQGSVEHALYRAADR
jgi:hypothetical protein